MGRVSFWPAPALLRRAPRSAHAAAGTVAVFLAAFALLGHASPVTASCYPPRASWVGSIFTGPANEGSVAPYKGRIQIEQYRPMIPTNTNGTPARVSAWVMLTDGVHWAQMGWIQIQNANGTSGGRWDWDQHMYDNGEFFDTFYNLSSTVGTFTKYAVWREAAGPPGTGVNYSFKLEDVNVKTLNLGNWTPNQTQWHGEINAYHNQMPGDDANHVKFKLVQYAGSDLIWHDADNIARKSYQGFAPGITPDMDHFGSIKLDSQTYSVWDEDCST
jgi:hypothetical protein